LREAEDTGRAAGVMGMPVQGQRGGIRQHDPDARDDHEQPATAATSSATPPAADPVSPMVSSARGGTRPMSRRDTWPATMMPRPLIAKIRLNSCGEMPNLACRTNGDPEI
jgi:hypothetical protein